jgi:molybdenum cofactor cytidylyltransferase
VDEPSPGLHAAILAAGAGTRFGDVKQLVRLRGEPVLHELATSAGSVAGQSVTVVLGAHARQIAPALRQRAMSVVINRGWEEGIASSVRAAVHSAPPGSSALLLMLADQVAVTADDLRRLHASWRRHPILIAAALFDGAPGLPAIFPHWVFTDLLGLRGDREPGSILRRNIDRVVRVPMSNAGINLDRPDDLLGLEEQPD